MLGVPFEDLEFLTQQNSIRTNGSSTAREASAAARYLMLRRVVLARKGLTSC